MAEVVCSFECFQHFQVDATFFFKNINRSFSQMLLLPSFILEYDIGYKTTTLFALNLKSIKLDHFIV